MFCIYHAFPFSLGKHILSFRTEGCITKSDTEHRKIKGQESMLSEPMTIQ